MAFEAAFWGVVGSAALLVGALLGLYSGASQRVIAVVIALGAGVHLLCRLRLMEEAYREGLRGAAIGLRLGALLYFAADLAVSRRAKHRKRSQGREGGSAAITVGALMDGIPESVAIGTSLVGEAHTGPVGCRHVRPSLGALLGSSFWTGRRATPSPPYRSSPPAQY